MVSRAFRFELAGPALVHAWNSQWPSGTRVALVTDSGKIEQTNTRSEAWALGTGQPVVRVEGRAGDIVLERMVPYVPGQLTHAQVNANIGHLVKVCKAVDHAISSLLAIREGLEDAVLETLQAQLRASVEIVER